MIESKASSYYANTIDALASSHPESSFICFVATGLKTAADPMAAMVGSQIVRLFLNNFAQQVLQK